MSPLKNNYLTLRSKVKVPQRSLRYVTCHLMVMHPHTKYHWPIWKDKKVMVRTSFAEKKRKRRKKKKSDWNNMSPFVRRGDIIISLGSLCKERNKSLSVWHFWFVLKWCFQNAFQHILCLFSTKEATNFHMRDKFAREKKKDPKHILCYCFHKLWIIAIRVYLFNLCLLWMGEWLLLYAKRAMFQLCHGENKLQFNEMIMVEQFFILALNNNQASHIYMSFECFLVWNRTYFFTS